MAKVYLGLGSNQGDRERHLAVARQEIEQQIGKIIRFSPIYESAPWGLIEQPWFLNQVVRVSTPMDPWAVLDAVKYIEKMMGRLESVKWGPRLIDIDILFYNHIRLLTPELQIPHLYLHRRSFVLKPLADIAPGLVHPTYSKTILQLRDENDDQGEIHVYKNKEES